MQRWADHGVLEMVTVNAAKAYGLPSLGSIEVGKRTDLVLIDMQKPHLTPCRDVVSNIVYSAKGSVIDNGMVDGRFLLRGGKVLTLDEESIVREAQRSQDEIMSRSGVNV